jgi:hypothetical protein
MTTGAEPIFHYGLSNGWVPHVRPGVRGTKKTGDPDFLYAAPPMFACAAFIKESRMKFLYSTKPHRKDGGKPHHCNPDAPNANIRSRQKIRASSA